MKYMTSEQIRNTWIEFWKSKGHSLEDSANLIPNNDKSLLWINSGVAALKKYFDGSVTPKNRRIVNVQKAIRTNDIDNVGFSARHHTFFEMMGNFSIGDYFRGEVLPWAYELLTDETLKCIANELKEVVEEYATIDWSKKKATQAKMRKEIKRLLRKYNYPPEYTEDAIQTVIKQAEYMM